MKKSKYTELRGILTGIPEGTALPFGKYIYQKTKAGLGNVPGDSTGRLQIRAWAPQFNPQTPAQRESRMAFRIGVAAWQKKSESEKEDWRAPGLKLGLNRFQAFMRDWMKTYWSEKMAILLDAGIYTPNGTAAFNITSISSTNGMFSRVGDIVTYSGDASVVVTTGGATCVLQLDMPIASAMSSNKDAFGIATCNDLAKTTGIVTGDAIEDKIRLNFTPPASGALTIKFTCQYIIK